MTEVGKGGNLRPSTQFSAANTWGPYWNALFPPSLVTEWIDFKRRSTGLNVARRLWDQREYLRRTYESVYGTDPEGWPSQHPGVVLDEVLWMAHAACLRCRWFDVGPQFRYLDSCLLRIRQIWPEHRLRRPHRGVLCRTTSNSSAHYRQGFELRGSKP